MNEQTHTTNETLLSKETNEEVSNDINAKQTTPEESGSASGETKPEQVTDFAQVYDMIKERDNTIDTLKKEISDLKKTNTNLMLKVNAASTGEPAKNPYEKFIDSMVSR